MWIKLGRKEEICLLFCKYGENSVKKQIKPSVIYQFAFFPQNFVDMWISIANTCAKWVFVVFAHQMVHVENPRPRQTRRGHVENMRNIGWITVCAIQPTREKMMFWNLDWRYVYYESSMA
jgi:hypothetical protein